MILIIIFLDEYEELLLTTSINWRNSCSYSFQTSSSK